MSNTKIKSASPEITEGSAPFMFMGIREIKRITENMPVNMARPPRDEPGAERLLPDLTVMSFFSMFLSPLTEHNTVDNKAEQTAESVENKIIHIKASDPEYKLQAFYRQR